MQSTCAEAAIRWPGRKGFFNEKNGAIELFVAAQENADGRLVAFGHHVGLEPIQIKIHLPGVGGLEGPDLEVDENMATEEPVEKDEIDAVVLATLGHAELAGFETEAVPKFEEETLKVIEQRGLELIFGISGQLGKSGELEHAGIAEQVGDGFLGLL